MLERRSHAEWTLAAAKALLALWVVYAASAAGCELAVGGCL